MDVEEEEEEEEEEDIRQDDLTAFLAQLEEVEGRGSRWCPMKALFHCGQGRWTGVHKVLIGLK